LELNELYYNELMKLNLGSIQKCSAKVIIGLDEESSKAKRETLVLTLKDGIFPSIGQINSAPKPANIYRVVDVSLN
jgi:hypothetical protein